MREPCLTPNCVRILNHAGVCSAWPGSATLDWDHVRAKQRADQELLETLDFVSPPWADLND